MNSADFERLVTRARTEGPHSAPPPDLLRRARTSARRRRRTTRLTGALAAVGLLVFAGVAVPRWLGADDPRRDEVASDSLAFEELDQYGVPCPEVLPTPRDDQGHGFGTNELAEEAPQFRAPDEAWICEYATRSIGRTPSGGTKFEWARTNNPRKIAATLLEPVAQALNSIRVSETNDRVCTDDLGVRWLLVTSAGGDLTGTAVDDFGCRDVRLTNDPFTVAPGDPQSGGTVAGVLTAGAFLPAQLQTWWDTSPADTTTSTAPDEVTLTCTASGPEVEIKKVAAQPAGVVVTTDSELPQGSYLTYNSPNGPSGGDLLRRDSPSRTYAFPPGEVTLGCAVPPSMDETGMATIEVQDPDGYWRESTLADYGCRAGGAQPAWTADLFTSGATAQQAIDRLVANLSNQLGGDYSAESAPTGYSGAQTQTWVAYRDGTPHLTLAVTRTTNGYSAAPDAFCGKG